MREIKFRGKRKDNQEWIYGGYYFDDCCGNKQGEKHYIITWNSFGLGFTDLVEVIPETVGQYTGLQDSKCVRIYEHDCLEAYWPNGTTIREQTTVKWTDNGQWNISRERIKSRGHVVAGNMHEVSP